MDGHMTLIEKLVANRDLTDAEFKELLETDKYDEELFEAARKVREEIYGKDVYLRGLVELTNYCKNDCYYCGIRKSNKNAERYRLTKEQIMNCCANAHELGFRTFVIQGGEDPYYTDERLCDIIGSIRRAYPENAITLSLGEKSYESYKKYYDAGANRYLLRHETADEELYRKLHPENLSLENRIRCLFDLKEIGYQVGSGFMVGAPYQTTEHLIKDLRFLQELGPHMIGIGPYVTHSETPFADFKSGTCELTVRLLGILRLMFPYSLIPATTALGSIDPTGREKGLMAGANVIMPNISPVDYRKLYDLYENKIAVDEEAAASLEAVKKRIESTGYRAVVAVGNAKNEQEM